MHIIVHVHCCAQVGCLHQQCVVVFSWESCTVFPQSCATAAAYTPHKSLLLNDDMRLEIKSQRHAQTFTTRRVATVPTQHVAILTGP